MSRRKNVSRRTKAKKNYVQRKCCVTFREWGNRAGLRDITNTLHSRGKKGERVKAKISFSQKFYMNFFSSSTIAAKNVNFRESLNSISTCILTKLVRGSAGIFVATERYSKKIMGSLRIFPETLNFFPILGRFFLLNISHICDFFY
jgi:hypothetical protein